MPITEFQKKLCDRVGSRLHLHDNDSDLIPAGTLEISLRPVYEVWNGALMAGTITVHPMLAGRAFLACKTGSNHEKTCNTLAEAVEYLLIETGMMAPGAEEKEVTKK